VPLCYKRTSSFAAGGSGMSVCLRPRLKTVATETHTADCAYLLAIRGHSNRLQNRLHLSRNGPSSSLRWRSTVVPETGRSASSMSTSGNRRRPVFHCAGRDRCRRQCRCRGLLIENPRRKSEHVIVGEQVQI
jgi:hypothetical protein